MTATVAGSVDRMKIGVTTCTPMTKGMLLHSLGNGPRYGYKCDLHWAGMLLPVSNRIPRQDV